MRSARKGGEVCLAGAHRADAGEQVVDLALQLPDLVVKGGHGVFGSRQV